MFTISKAASAQAYPKRSRKAYSILLVGAANRAPTGRIASVAVTLRMILEWSDLKLGGERVHQEHQYEEVERIQRPPQKTRGNPRATGPIGIGKGCPKPSLADS